jgi:hypothetical protein
MDELEKTAYKSITVPNIKKKPTFFAEYALVHNTPYEWKPATIHALADKFKVKWDNDPKFMEMCTRLTGKAHLDKMEASQLRTIAQAITMGMR